MISGGLDAWMHTREEIYQLDTNISMWVAVGRLKAGRMDHGVSVINYDRVAKFCF